MLPEQEAFGRRPGGQTYKNKQAGRQAGGQAGRQAHRQTVRGKAAYVPCISMSSQVHSFTVSVKEQEAVRCFVRTSPPPKDGGRSFECRAVGPGEDQRQRARHPEAEAGLQASTPDASYARRAFKANPQREDFSCLGRFDITSRGLLKHPMGQGEAIMRACESHIT